MFLLQDNEESHRSPESPISPHAASDTSMPFLQLAPNQIVAIQSDAFTVGADPVCNLVLGGEGVAPRHLIFQRRDDESWQVALLALKAPAYLNGRPIKMITPLVEGDVLRVGDKTLVWRQRMWEDLHTTSRQTPWQGLLLIFLAVLATLSVFFTWFSLSNAYRTDLLLSSGSMKIETVVLTPTSPALTPAPTEEPALTPVATNPAGHPVYHMTLPKSGS